MNEFWKQSNEFAINNDMDMNLAYMLTMVKRAKGKFYVTKEALRKYGSQIKLYAGVKDWFGRINAYGAERGIIVEHPNGARRRLTIPTRRSFCSELKRAARI